ncbi:hypothetical protein JTB14_032922 [Gonioctena quinquepunctata]|nr:hypothetical protein JTB14_032922 [Gonioctena quinquepunctata]
MNSQVEKVEADSTTWWLPDDVLVEDVTEDGPIQLPMCHPQQIVDDNDDADSDATIETEEADEQNYDVNINDEAPMELNDEF